MGRSLKKILVFFFVFASFAPASAQSSKYPELIVGRWKFESFKFPNFIDPNSAEVKRATAAHKEVVYIFSADKKFSIEKAGFKQPLQKGIYGFIKNNKSFIVKDTRSKAETE